jgi:peptidoglycan/xylan/chitin deacetylase (PgdA/CDA1 family)
VKRIVSEGHEVGNHTWSHPHLTTFASNKQQTTVQGMTSERLRNELGKTASLFEVVTKQTMTDLWRAPYGEYNPEILGWAAHAGYKHVGWTVGKGPEESMDTMDWVADKTSKAYRSSEEIVRKIFDYSKNKKTGASGAVILMHLGTERKDDFPHRKIPEIIQGLRKEGYALVRVSEMLPGE